MFDNLKKAFSDVSKGFSEKELNEKDIEDVLFELEINLLESDVAIEKNHSDALNYLESRLKELEIALQDTNKQRQQIAANLEQGKQQMQNFMQTSQNPTK